jgi:multidrug efflux pump subunit AcrA (membrane-fusion protein)
VEFQKTLLEAIRELAAFRVEAQKEVVARLEKLQAAGDKTEKEVVAERVNLKQFEIQGRREVHEGENALKVSQKTEAALSRQLQQAGLEPTLLRSAAAEGEIVVAEVPEGATARVKLGMTCEVRFFAMRDRLFTGKVSSMSPVITKEKRILNVQFIVKDPDGLIRPGMFAEIGLGTDPRQALLVPADGVLHIDDKDLILIVTSLADDKIETLKIVDVQTGEPWPLYRLTEKSVASLRAAEVPDGVIAKLAPLKKRGFATSDELTAALAKALDAKEFERFRESILSQAEREPNIEVRSGGVKAGETVLGKGAILLKPVVVRALQAPAAERGGKGR